MAREVADLSSCCAVDAVRSGCFTKACSRAFASSGVPLVVRGVWELFFKLVVCGRWLLLRVGDLSVCSRPADLERDIGASANCVDADMLYF